jgi:predicted Zn-dependent protease with MMP-like domain
MKPVHDLSSEEFDALVEAAISELPENFRRFLDTIPILIEDEPSPGHLELLEPPPDDEDEDELYGLYVGTPITEQSPVEAPILEPGRIYLFRGPLLRLADGDPEILEEEIHITLLHEIGHHFGMDEEDLERLGYD